VEGNPATSAAINNELKMLLEEGEGVLVCQAEGQLCQVLSSHEDWGKSPAQRAIQSKMQKRWR